MNTNQTDGVEIQPCRRRPSVSLVTWPAWLAIVLVVAACGGDTAADDEARPTSGTEVVAALSGAINGGDVAGAQALLAVEKCAFPFGGSNCNDWAEYLVASNATVSFDCQELTAAAGVQMSCTMTEANDVYEALGTSGRHPVTLLISEGAITKVTISGAYTVSGPDDEFFTFLRDNYPELYDQRGGPVLTGESGIGLVQAAKEFIAGQ